MSRHRTQLLSSFFFYTYFPLFLILFLSPLSFSPFSFYSYVFFPFFHFLLSLTIFLVFIHFQFIFVYLCPIFALSFFPFIFFSHFFPMLFFFYLFDFTLSFFTDFLFYPWFYHLIYTTNLEKHDELLVRISKKQPCYKVQWRCQAPNWPKLKLCLSNFAFAWKLLIVILLINC